MNFYNRVEIVTTFILKIWYKKFLSYFVIYKTKCILAFIYYLYTWSI